MTTSAKGLTPENAALIERLYPVFGPDAFVDTNGLEDLLNAARAEEREKVTTPDREEKARRLRNWIDRRYYKTVTWKTAFAAIDMLDAPAPAPADGVADV